MKTILKILWLQASIGKLQNKRRDAVLDISTNHPKQAGRVNCIEDVNPTYFKEIDADIEAREKLVSILSKNFLKNFSSINNTKV